MTNPIAYAACRNRTIFLALSEGRYFCLTPACDTAFRQLLGGDRSTAVLAALLPLFDKGFPDSSPPDDRLSHVGDHHRHASRDLCTVRPSAKRFWRHMPLVWWSLICANRTIKRRGFCGVVDQVEQWSRRPALRKPLAGNLDLLEIFRISRSYMPWKRGCLLDSLALLRFLRAFNMGATLIIGVTDQPFSAHCWLQEDDCVLNDSLEHAANFTPIAAWAV